MMQTHEMLRTFRKSIIVVPIVSFIGFVLWCYYTAYQFSPNVTIVSGFCFSLGFTGIYMLCVSPILYDKESNYSRSKRRVGCYLDDKIVMIDGDVIGHIYIRKEGSIKSRIISFVLLVLAALTPILTNLLGFYNISSVPDSGFSTSIVFILLVVSFSCSLVAAYYIFKEMPYYECYLEWRNSKEN